MVIDKLIDKIKATGNPTVVGLDPNQAFIPSFIKEEAFAKHGKTLKGMSKAILTFNKMIIDEIYDLVPAIKPQIAMYERYGIPGLKAYVKTIEYAKKRGLIIIGDIKRGDIASTGQAYSDGHIGRADVDGIKYEAFKEDFITLNPYLGSDSITPFLEDCKEYEKGLFILAKTSNPNSGEIQDLLVDGAPIYEKVGSLISKWGEELIGVNGFSEVGAVVGATHPEQAKRLRELMPHTFFLVPGYGAQGGKAEDLAVCFNKDGLGAIVNSSRGI
ncbi:MAG: orotidine-5'-phosphate decarboxylase, partial [Clostridia bacterium]|nr:orotidine-5'-phosphate decarboxylase [Clostridia bacterium]